MCCGHHRIPRLYYIPYERPIEPPTDQENYAYREEATSKFYSIVDGNSIDDHDAMVAVNSIGSVIEGIVVMTDNHNDHGDDNLNKVDDDNGHNNDEGDDYGD